MAHVEALKALAQNSDGYCLWVGAGVTRHLADSSPEVPLWNELVEAMEVESGSVDSSGEGPDRLQRCLEAMGRRPFQRLLRQRIVEGLASALVEQARRACDQTDVVPKSVRQVAHLGSLANPIVNFNVEVMTSTVLASPGGPYEVKYFVPPVSDAIQGMEVSTARFGGGHFQRHALHPHGALTHSGVCVLGRKDYESLRGTLAFQLALHAAFQCKLVIVGMSLEDTYLREQLGDFRTQIRDVVWFVDSPPADQDLANWAVDHSVTVVPVPSWPLFWDSVEEHLPAPEELELLRMWWSLVGTAHDRLTSSWVSHHLQTLGSAASEALLRFRDNLGEDPDRSGGTRETDEEERKLRAPILAAIRALEGG